MNEIPTRIYALVGAEAGFFVGFGIILAVTLRSIARVTNDHRWTDLSYVDSNIKYRR